MKKKNSVPIVDFFELLSVSIAARETMLVLNQVCATLAQYWNLSCSNEATNYCWNGNILVVSNGGYDLHTQEHPFVDKHLRLDHFQSYDCGTFISYESIMDALEELLLALLLQLVGRIIYYLSPSFLPYRCPWGRPFLMTYSGIERSSIVYLMNFWFSPSFTQEVPHVP